jgi:hypothetical protein
MDNKETLRSAIIVFGGVFVGWVTCMTILVQYVAGL